MSAAFVWQGISLSYGQPRILRWQSARMTDTAVRAETETMRWRLGTAFAIGALLAAGTGWSPASTPAADSVLTPDATALYVAASHGLVAWSRRGQDGRFRLVLYRDGQAQDLPIPTSARPYRASFGLSPSGKLNLAYARNRGLWRYDPSTGVERQIPARGLGPFDLVAIHGRRFAYSAGGELRVVDLSGRTLFTRRTDHITTLALNATYVAWGELIDDLAPYVRLRALRSHRTTTVGRNWMGGVGGAAYQTSAQFLGNHLYWLEPQIGESGGSAGIARVRLDAKHPNCSWASRSLKNANLDLPSSLAIDGPDAYYTYGDFTTTEQTASTDGVHSTSAASLRFARPDPRRCP